MECRCERWIDLDSDRVNTIVKKFFFAIDGWRSRGDDDDVMGRTKGRKIWRERDKKPTGNNP